MRDPALTNVFAFTDKRDAVARFYEEVVGLARQAGTHDDSVWFEPGSGATLTLHDREDEPAEWGFIPWFHVIDLAAAFERARSQGANVGDLRDGYFLARDPDRRMFGVRQWR
jgi:predicted enzyme related to lactoylglutathione lyase